MREVFIRDTHRGLWYEDGVLIRVLEAGRYVIPTPFHLGPWRRKRVEVELVDVRQRELTIKGQEILTRDKVAVRVSIVAQFRVVDPRAALHQVASYEDRLYSDIQLAARRSLASMTLEEILTNRNRLSEEILADVRESAAVYGVELSRADVKDLVFPGNLQEIMNRVLAAERLSEAQLVEARTKAEVDRIGARTRAETDRLQAEERSQAERLAAESAAAARKIRGEAELETIRRRSEVAALYEAHPALLRFHELEAMQSLAGNANARIYVGFDKHLELEE